MAIDILQLLSKFKDINNFHFEGRSFYTNVPSIAPKAYLYTVYDPIKNDIIESLGFTNDIQEFYSKYNGASLFIGGINIYGVHKEGQLLHRGDWRRKQPLNLVEINKELFGGKFDKDFIAIGSYGYDKSRVLLEVQSGNIICCIQDNIKNERKRWDSFEIWLTEEIERLSTFFDEDGNRIKPEEEMLPQML